MSLDPVQRLIEEIESLKTRIKSLETAPFQQNLTVDKGATKILSEEGFFIGEPGNTAGSGVVYGTLTIVGTLEGEGQLDWLGEWTLIGDGGIEGDVVQTGTYRVEAPGEILVGGAMKLTPSAGGGSVEFDTGARLQSDSAVGGAQFRASSGWRVYVGANGFALHNPDSPGGGSVTVIDDQIFIGGGTVTINSNRLVLGGLPVAANTDGVTWLGRQGGQLKWFPPNVGGPIGSGEFAWPFPLSTVPDDPDAEYGPRPGIGSGFHHGLDFAVPEGTEIPAPAAGTVLANAWDAERGWYVILDHGTRAGQAVTTRYYHLQSQSPLAVGTTVTKGQALGPVGDTGLSFGAHLHWETRMDGESMNPRSFMAIYGS